MVEITRIARECIAVACGVDTSPPKLLSFLICEVPPVPLVQHTICERASGAHREEISFQTRTIGVDIKQCRALEGISYRRGTTSG
jgi:hypothetical protein